MALLTTLTGHRRGICIPHYIYVDTVNKKGSINFMDFFMNSLQVFGKHISRKIPYGQDQLIVPSNDGV